METKLKLCEGCKKEKQIWKRHLGKPFCKSCSDKLQKTKAKEKRAAVRKKKAETITERKLDQVTSRLVRTVYPLFCHGCGIQLEFNTAQSCHFVSRKARSVRFSILNQLPGCKRCNFYDQSHVYSLGIWLNKYWGEGTAENIRIEGNQLQQWSKEQKRLLYDLYLNPPQGKTPEETRELILQDYLKIKNG